MINVLVFPAGTEISLEIHRSLKDSKHFRLFGASSVDDHARFVFDNYIGGAPYCDKAGFGIWLKGVVKSQKIDIVIPAHDDAVVAISNMRKDLAVLGARFASSSNEACNILRSKAETYRIFNEISPKYRDEFPKFAKPDKGNGGKRCYILNHEQDEKEIKGRFSDMVITEFLHGEEYTVDCFTDRHGVLRFCEGRVRGRVSNGISVFTERAEKEYFRDFAEYIMEKFEMRGAWFFQVKEDQYGDPALLEIAPRIAGSSGLWRAHGVNLAELTLWDAMDKDVEILFQDFPVQMSRALSSVYRLGIEFDTVYIDFDDTVYLSDGWNPQASALFDLLENKDKRIIVITKNTMLSAINKYDLILVPKNDPKSKYINPEGAIFIDDSFAERKEVHDALGIPVFGLDAIEALM